MGNNCAATHQISLTEITSNSPEASVAAARELLLEYGRFVIAQPGAAQFCFGSLEKEAEGLPDSYSNEGGGCLLACIDDIPTGFVAWRKFTAEAAPDAWEMKRLWVRPAGRGAGLGKTLTQSVIDRARAANQTAIYLDTVPASMASAYRLYLDLGFKPCPPFNNSAMDGIEYLSLKL